MLRHMKAFNSLRPLDVTKARSADVYVRAAGDSKFWFVGKSTAGDEVSAAEAVVSSDVEGANAVELA